MLTPRNPRITPSALFRLSRSSEKKIDARNTVKIAVEALMMLARPELICCCPQTISENGIALFRNPKIRNFPASNAPMLTGILRHITHAHIQTAATPTRTATTENTGTVSRAMRFARNDPPQITPIVSKSTHASAERDFCCVIGVSDHTPRMATIRKRTKKGPAKRGPVKHKVTPAIRSWC